MIGIVNHSDEEGFSFISDERLPAGMFVCYHEEERNILCRVKKWGTAQTVSSGIPSGYGAFSG